MYKRQVEFIVSIENLRSKEDLDLWCGDMGKKKLYLYIQRLAPEHWKKLRYPEADVRACYQQMLIGYRSYDQKTVGV